MPGDYDAVSAKTSSQRLRFIVSAEDVSHFTPESQIHCITADVQDRRTMAA